MARKRWHSSRELPKSKPLGGCSFRETFCNFQSVNVQQQKIARSHIAKTVPSIIKHETHVSARKIELGGTAVEVMQGTAKVAVGLMVDKM